MTNKDRILSFLVKNKGSFISGEQIANTLSISRTSVWKAIKSLQSEGYSIEAVTNKGYSLSKDTDVLSVEFISKYIKDDINELRLEKHNSVSSTNNIARELANNGEPEGIVVLADKQTAGRGRKNRNYFSPAGTGLYMSILLRPKFSIEYSLFLTTAAATAVSIAIEKISGKITHIKWVNDVWMDGKKVSGILTEADLSMENGGLDYVIVGIGVNVFEPKEGFPKELSDIATSVFKNNETKGNIRNRLAAEILNNFIYYYRNLEKKTFLPEYKKRSFIIGKNVTVINNDNCQKAIALDIDDNCHLIVKYENGKIEALSSGEISIKL